MTRKLSQRREKITLADLERIRKLDERTAEIIGRTLLGDDLYERVMSWKLDEADKEKQCERT